MARRAEKLLTDVAEPLATKFAQRYGNLKSVLSAGVMALGRLTSAERENMLDLANGIVPDDVSQQAAEAGRFFIKKLQALNPKEFAITLQFLAPDESRAIKEIFNLLKPDKRSSRSKTA